MANIKDVAEKLNTGIYLAGRWQHFVQLVAPIPEAPIPIH